MTNLSKRDANHLFEKLRGGTVPERGLDSYAVGIEKELAELDRQLKLVQDGEGQIKFLRGGYGCGKTFMARLSVERAKQQGFATSFVVVSPNDLRFHRFDEVYNKVVTGLGTASCPRQALGDILDRWICNEEEALIGAGADEDADDFDDLVAKRLSDSLKSKMGDTAPPQFIKVIGTVFELKQSGDLANANALLSWLSGSGNVDAATKRLAGIKGEISSADAMSYLRGIVEIVKAAGYQGLLIVIDEAETILRMRSDQRNKSLNAIRQIADVSGSYSRLLWLFTGTPEFFDSRQGVAGLSPLHDRIQFHEEGGFASRRQPQLNLRPFDRERLVTVSKRLKELYVATLRETELSDDEVNTRIARHRDLISDTYIEALVDSVTEGFRGDVGVVPRQYLRKFIGAMDLVRDEEEYNPTTILKASGYKPPKALNAEEEAAFEGKKLEIPDASDDLVPTEDAW